MAVTDIAEALTAKDRPYKKAMPLEQVYKILRTWWKEMSSTAIWLSFLSTKKYMKYIRQNMKRLTQPSLQKASPKNKKDP